MAAEQANLQFENDHESEYAHNLSLENKAENKNLESDTSAEKLSEQAKTAQTVAKANLTTQEVVAAIEAIIFAAGDPVSEESLMAYFDLKKSDLDKIMSLIKDSYAQESHGIELRKIANSYTLASKVKVGVVLQDFFSTEFKPLKLSQASYETLAVVAYNQPVTRAEIEEVRGVNSDSALNRLVEKGLVETVGSLAGPGRPSLFATTDLFLKLFGIESTKELEPMDMLMYDTVREFEQSYKRAGEKSSNPDAQIEQEQPELDSGDDLGTVY